MLVLDLLWPQPLVTTAELQLFVTSKRLVQVTYRPAQEDYFHPLHLRFESYCFLVRQRGVSVQFTPVLVLVESCGHQLNGASRVS